MLVIHIGTNKPNCMINYPEEYNLPLDQFKTGHDITTLNDLKKEISILTCSNYFIKGICLAVAKKMILPSQIKIIYTNKDQTVNITSDEHGEISFYPDDLFGLDSVIHQEFYKVQHWLYENRMNCFRN